MTDDNKEGRHMRTIHDGQFLRYMRKREIA